jgi:hypothetical protein
VDKSKFDLINSKMDCSLDQFTCMKYLDDPIGYASETMMHHLCNLAKMPDNPLA